MGTDAPRFSAVSAGVLTAIVLSVPVPLYVLAFGSGPWQLDYLFGTPILLTVVASVVVWRRGWSQRVLLGAFVGLVVTDVFWIAVSGHHRLPLNYVAATLVFDAIFVLATWGLGGLIGSALRRRDGTRPIDETAAPQRLGRWWLAIAATMVACFVVLVMRGAESRSSETCTVNAPGLPVPIVAPPRP